jgi:hypothetical protein
MPLSIVLYFFFFLTQNVLIHAFPVDVLIDEPNFNDDVIDLTRFGDSIYGDPSEEVGKIVNDWTPDSNVNPEELGTYLEGDMLITNSDARNGITRTSSRSNL